MDRRESGRKNLTTFAAKPRAQGNVEEVPPTLPSNLDAERSILGAILLEDKALPAAIKSLKPDDFFIPQHRNIFTRMIALAEAQQCIDLVTVNESLIVAGQLEASGGAPYLASLVDGMPRVTNVEHYARIVKEKAMLRNLIHATHNIQQRAFEGEAYCDILTDASVAISELAKSADTGVDWRRKFHTVDELSDSEPDFLIDGILPAGVTFIGALSGTGKTWLGLSMCRALATGKKFLGNFAVPQITNCLYLVPEMGSKPFKARAKLFGLPGNSDLFRCMTIQDGAPLDLDDPLLAAAIRELKPAVYLDTAIRFAGMNDENSSAENASGLGRAIFHLIHLGAKAVVCLHHRAKETARVEEMTLENVLRGTGDLGAIADAVWGMQHDRGPGGPEHLRVSKEIGRIHVRCVKMRDSKPIPDFKVQLYPFVDQIQDFGMLTEESESTHLSETERLSVAIEEKPNSTKVELEQRTGIGRNRIEKLARDAGWSYLKRSGWQRRLS